MQRLKNIVGKSIRLIAYSKIYKQQLTHQTIKAILYSYNYREQFQDGYKSISRNHA